MFDLISNMHRQYGIGQRAAPANRLLPVAWNIPKDAVRAMGFSAAVRQAAKVASRTGRPVSVPVPGSRRRKVVMPARKRAPRFAVPKVKASVLPAMVRGPKPDSMIRPGQRGPASPGQLKKMALIEERRAKISALRAKRRFRGRRPPSPVVATKVVLPAKPGPAKGEPCHSDLIALSRMVPLILNTLRGKGKQAPTRVMKGWNKLTKRQKKAVVKSVRYTNKGNCKAAVGILVKYKVPV
jgi:hypothetical protein